jgi:hypothetical protein
MTILPMIRFRGLSVLMLMVGMLVGCATPSPSLPERVAPEKVPGGNAERL